MKIKVKIGDLVESIAEFQNEKLLDNIQVYCQTPNAIKVPTPNGDFANINAVIKKHSSTINIVFDNGHVLKCASKHILYKNNKETYAEQLSVGDNVDTSTGKLRIEKITTPPDQAFYDISIPAPHMYCDNIGIIHHNTLLTATLSQLIEPYGRSIVIVPNKSLVEQTEEDYTNLGLDVGVFYGDRKEWGHLHTICTWQSLGSFSKKTKAGETEIPIEDFLDGVACVMVDECFSKDTPILTPTGYRPISEIKIDDTVINYDPILKEFKEDTVVKVHNNLANSTNEKMYELEFDNGVVVSCTGNHKFLTTDGWVKAEDLQDSHELINTLLRS